MVALLTGNDLTVGQRMPAGYDVYNVPGAYQDRYYDTNDAMYRYADGRVYQIDPTTMLIAKGDRPRPVSGRLDRRHGSRGLYRSRRVLARPTAGPQQLADTAPAAPRVGTVAAALTGVDNHRKLSAALADTQLAPVLDGKGDYTLLAPSDAAFDALGEKGKALSAKEQRPLMIAVLRGHILPGQVTARSIEQAIARKKGPVAMRTMLGDTVRFAKTAKGLSVSNGKQTAMLEAGDTTASNGAVLPIDKVLLPAN